MGAVRIDLETVLAVAIRAGSHLLLSSEHVVQRIVGFHSDPSTTSLDGRCFVSDVAILDENPVWLEVGGQDHHNQENVCLLEVGGLLHGIASSTASVLSAVVSETGQPCS